MTKKHRFARRPRALAVPALLIAALVAGACLAIAGFTGAGQGPHDQPLPEALFALPPTAAAELPEPAGGCAPARSDRPRVTVPSLCIDAPLIRTHIENGALIVPQDVSEVGADSGSAELAAAAGTTVLAGHVDDYNQGDGALRPLYRTQPGARITVTDFDGQISEWVVYAIDVRIKQALPQDLWSTTGPRRLVLVTCGGPLLHLGNGRNTYQDNVLVYAAPA